MKTKNQTCSAWLRLVSTNQPTDEKISALLPPPNADRPLQNRRTAIDFQTCLHCRLTASVGRSESSCCTSRFSRSVEDAGSLAVDRQVNLIIAGCAPVFSARGPRVPQYCDLLYASSCADGILYVIQLLFEHRCVDAEEEPALTAVHPAMMRPAMTQ